MRTANMPSIVDSAHGFTPPSAGTLRAVLHRAVGALQLLFDDGHPVALHERGAAVRRGPRRARVRRVHRRSVLPAALRRPARRPRPRLQPGRDCRRRADDARSPRPWRRISAIFLRGAGPARLRQWLAQAERVDARRESVSRPAGAARSGIQHLLYGHQPRRVHLAADVSWLRTHYGWGPAFMSAAGAMVISL